MPSSAGLKKRILLVDDDPDVTAILSRILIDNGFEVWSVNRPNETLKRAREVRPDLIVLDFDMPPLLGTELALLLKGDPTTAKIPIIFLSGMADEDHRVIGESSGAAAYLSKPVPSETLIQTINSVLGR